MVASRLISISKKLIKPSSPTSSPLRHLKLSQLDQVITNWYMPLAFFYPRHMVGNSSSFKASTQISQVLEASLSRTLASYYPFAGRLRNNAFIDCNDMGAKFLNVRFNCPMSEVVNLPDTGPEYLPFPKDLPWNCTKDEDSLVVAQLSHFDCGGIAISACISHKLGDACSACNFIYDWAIIIRNADMKIPSPQLVGPSIFPPNNENSLAGLKLEPQTQCTTKRYFFSSSRISALKAVMASQSGVKNPTRVEVTSALLYKSAMAASRATSGSFKPSLLNQLVNLRPRMLPPLPQNSIGNIITSMSILTTKEEDMNLPSMVRELRKKKELLKEKDPVKENEFLIALMNFQKNQERPSNANEFDIYWSSSDCNYLMYSMDFGLGKPERTIVPTPFKNSLVLMDSKSGDEIEAIISLEEQVMAEFEKDKELLEYGSPYTSIKD